LAKLPERKESNVIYKFTLSGVWKNFPDRLQHTPGIFIGLVHKAADFEDLDVSEILNKENQGSGGIKNDVSEFMKA
jgi:hypothetical protein